MEKLPVAKKESGVSRIVGVEESMERELLGYFKEQFEKNQRDDAEQEHSQELNTLINEINEKMKEFMAKYGVRSLDISGRNIHIIDESKLSSQQLAWLRERYGKSRGIYLPNRQQIVLFEDYTAGNKLRFAQILVHEMIHANAFCSFQKVDNGSLMLKKGDESVVLDIRRGGLEIRSAKTGRIFFHNINEAITEELTIRFDRDYFSQFRGLKQEYEERERAIKDVARKSGRRESDILISYLERKAVNTHDDQGIILRTYSFHNEREKLRRLINELYENNKNEFKSPDDVFAIFAKAVLTGRLLPLARLIEGTYGKGSFRYLAEETIK